MDDDVSVTAMKMQDLSELERDGTISRWRQYRFWLGKHGPFTEKVPLTTPFDEQEIGRRVLVLQQHARMLPK